MQILGIRTSPTAVRFAIVNWDGQAATVLNTTTENKLDFPASKTTSAEKLHWVRGELLRLIRQNPNVERIAIKCSEFGVGRERSASREAAYLDAAVLLVAGETNLPVEMLLYRAIGTKRDEVKKFAENNVGKGEPYWNEQMADAIAVAFAARNH